MYQEEKSENCAVSARKPEVAVQLDSCEVLGEELSKAITTLEQKLKSVLRSPNLKDECGESCKEPQLTYLAEAIKNIGRKQRTHLEAIQDISSRFEI